MAAIRPTPLLSLSTASPTLSSTHLHGRRTPSAANRGGLRCGASSAGVARCAACLSQATRWAGWWRRSRSTKGTKQSHSRSSRDWWQPRLRVSCSTSGSSSSDGTDGGAATAVDPATLPLPEGSLGLPWVGETFGVLANPDTFGSDRVARYGPLWKTNILGSPTVMVYGEEDAKKILSAENRLVEVTWPDVTAALVGPNSLNLLRGDRHLRVKRLLGEAFSEAALASYIPRIEAIVHQCLESWVELGRSSGPLSAFHESRSLAFAIFSAVVLGLPANAPSVARNLHLMDQVSAGFQSLPLNLPFLPYRQALKAREDLAAQCREVIAAARRGSGPATSGLALQARALDRDGAQLSDEELVDNVFAMLFGNAGAGPSIAKLLQGLSQRPDVLARVREELQEVVARHGGAGFSLPVLEEMRLADAVVRETLRFTPVVPTMFRKALVDFELRGRRVPKGWTIFVSTGDGVFKYNHDTFDPDRWLAAGNSSRSTGECPFEFSLPFGSGQRMCLGRPFMLLALKVALVVLARGYDWTLDDPGEEWGIFPTASPRKGLELKELRHVG